MFGFSTVKLIGLAIVAAAILSFVLLALHWESTMEKRGNQLDTICAATRAAADNSRLDCGLVVQQIGEFGKSIADLKTGIANQNAAVSNLAKETADAQEKAAQASQEAARRAKRSSSVSADLAASARSPERTSAPCAPSKALQGAWQ